MKKKYISYCRLSGRRQAKTGNSFASQEGIIEQYVSEKGGEIVEKYREIISGRKYFKSRLFNAIELAKELGATIVVSDIDRIGRKKDIILNIIYNSGVDFEIVNIKEETMENIERSAEYAELEWDKIRERSIRGLSHAKKQGVKLGNNTNLDQARKKAIFKNVANKNEFSDKIKNIIIELLKTGKANTHREIAEHLNNQNIPTRLGKKWHTTSIRRILNKSVKKFLVENSCC